MGRAVSHQTSLGIERVHITCMVKDAAPQSNASSKATSKSEATMIATASKLLRRDRKLLHSVYPLYHSDVMVISACRVLLVASTNWLLVVLELFAV